MAIRIPSGLAASCHKTPERAAWLARLPSVLRDLQRRWSLKLDPPFDGEASCSYVAAAVAADGTPSVLKIGMPHMEGEQEIQGLRFWGGDPTVQLLMADEDVNAMLLERCEPGTVLRALPECEQDVVISGTIGMNGGGYGSCCHCRILIPYKWRRIPFAARLRKHDSEERAIILSIDCLPVARDRGAQGGVRRSVEKFPDE